MTAEYRPVEYGKDYDVVNNPDKFQLYIDGKEVEELSLIHISMLLTKEHHREVLFHRRCVIMYWTD